MSMADGPPPPSPLTGCYLLIVLGEPHTTSHKDAILQRLAKGLLSWNVQDCLVDLEKELSIVTEQGLQGEEARYGERLIQFASENLVTEILIHPSVSTLTQCIRNLLSSFTRHRHIIHAGYTFAANGSWILQDGTFSLADFSEAFQESDVQRVIHAYENGISIDIHCSSEGDWMKLPKETFTKPCKLRINPNDVLDSGSSPITSFIRYISQFLVPAELESVLESSDVVGNIRFSRPTLYIFPGGQGDAALFGINGFNMLVDGGFSRKACFWDFVRHLDRLDAVLLTRLNNGNMNGIGAVVRRKAQNAVYPQMGHFFCNIQARRAALSPDGDKDKDPLLVNLQEEGQELTVNLRKLELIPQTCYRDSEPINLYHKVGHGTLDMYVLNPSKDSREVREFLLRWNNNDQKLFANHRFGKDLPFPLQNILSICALLVWRPANPNDTITRILFPGSAPQAKIFEGLEKLKNLECIKHSVCTEKILAPPPKLKSRENILDKILPSNHVDKPKKRPAKPQQSVENKTIDNSLIQNGHVNKSGSVESDKSDAKMKKKDVESSKTKPEINGKSKPKEKKPTTPKKGGNEIKESDGAAPAKSAKDANNKKVLESKKQLQRSTAAAPAAKKETKQTEPKKVERKPISRRPAPPASAKQLPQSPVKKPQNGASKRLKLDKDGATDSSTVSTPSVEQDLKKDVAKLTPEQVQHELNLAELEEEQEAIKELEAVFRKSDGSATNIRHPEPEEYLIVEKVTAAITPANDVKEEETVKLARDSEESEKKKDVELDESGIGEQETDEEARENEGSADAEENKKVPSSKDGVSAAVESGATTTAPTLPEDERIPLNEIKEQIEEKHVKEDTKEKGPEVNEPSVELPVAKPARSDDVAKLPNIAGLRLDKENRIRDIVKTPDEVADLPVHEEVDDVAVQSSPQEPKPQQQVTALIKEEIEKLEMETSPKEEADKEEKEMEDVAHEDASIVRIPEEKEREQVESIKNGATESKKSPSAPSKTPSPDVKEADNVELVETKEKPASRKASVTKHNEETALRRDEVQSAEEVGKMSRRSSIQIDANSEAGSRKSSVHKIETECEIKQEIHATLQELDEKKGDSGKSSVREIKTESRKSSAIPSTDDVLKTENDERNVQEQVQHKEKRVDSRKSSVHEEEKSHGTEKRKSSIIPSEIENNRIDYKEDEELPEASTAEEKQVEEKRESVQQTPSELLLEKQADSRKSSVHEEEKSHGTEKRKSSIIPSEIENNRIDYKEDEKLPEASTAEGKQVEKRRESVQQTPSELLLGKQADSRKSSVHEIETSHETERRKNSIIPSESENDRTDSKKDEKQPVASSPERKQVEERREGVQQTPSELDEKRVDSRKVSVDETQKMHETSRRKSSLIPSTNGTLESEEVKNLELNAKSPSPTLDKKVEPIKDGITGESSSIHQQTLSEIDGGSRKSSVHDVPEKIPSRKSSVCQEITPKDGTIQPNDTVLEGVIETNGTTEDDKTVAINKNREKPIESSERKSSVASKEKSRTDAEIPVADKGQSRSPSPKENGADIEVLSNDENKSVKSKSRRGSIQTPSGIKETEIKKDQTETESQHTQSRKNSVADTKISDISEQHFERDHPESRKSSPTHDISSKPDSRKASLTRESLAGSRKSSVVEQQQEPHETKSMSNSITPNIVHKELPIVENEKIENARKEIAGKSPTQPEGQVLQTEKRNEEREQSVVDPTSGKGGKSSTPSPKDASPERKLSVSAEGKSRTPSPTVFEEKLILTEKEKSRSPSPKHQVNVEEESSDRKLSISEEKSQKSQSPVGNDENSIKSSERKHSVTGNEKSRTPSPSAVSGVRERKLSIAEKELSRSPSPEKKFDEKSNDRKLSISGEKEEEQVLHVEERNSEKPPDRKIVSEIEKSRTPSPTVEKSASPSPNAEHENVEVPAETKLVVVNREKSRSPSPDEKFDVKSTYRKVSVSEDNMKPQTPIEETSNIAKTPERKLSTSEKDEPALSETIPEKQLHVSEIEKSRSPSPGETIKEKVEEKESSTSPQEMTSAGKLGVTEKSKSPSPELEKIDEGTCQIPERKQSIPPSKIVDESSDQHTKPELSQAPSPEPAPIVPVQTPIPKTTEQNQPEASLIESVVPAQDINLNRSISDSTVKSENVKLATTCFLQQEKQTSDEPESANEKDKTFDVKIKLTDGPEHAEPVLLKSSPESPIINDIPQLPTLISTEIDKLELGRKSPKEREEDVAKIVASVATVLKSDAPLEEFHGKVPITTATTITNTPSPYGTFELRETHITTCGSPITHEAQDVEESGTVHRMLVTASSEDGGEETEICPAGSITFSKSSESSGRSSPETAKKTGVESTVMIASKTPEAPDSPKPAQLKDEAPGSVAVVEEVIIPKSATSASEIPSAVLAKGKSSEVNESAKPLESSKPAGDDEPRGFFSGVLGGLAKSVKKIEDAITESVEEIIQSVDSGIEETKTEIAKAESDLIERFKDSKESTVGDPKETVETKKTLENVENLDSSVEKLIENSGGEMNKLYPTLDKEVLDVVVESKPESKESEGVDIVEKKIEEESIIGDVLGLTSKLGAVTSGLIGKSGDLVKDLKTAANNEFENLDKTIKAGVEETKTKFEEFCGKIDDTTKDISRAVESVQEVVSEKIQDAASDSTSKIEQLQENAKQTVSDIPMKTERVVQDSVKDLKEIIERVDTKLEETKTSLKTEIEDVAKKVESAGSENINKLTSFGKDAQGTIESVTQLVEEKTDSLAKQVEINSSNVVNSCQQLKESLESKTEGFTGKLSGEIEKLGGETQTVIGDVSNVIKKEIDDGSTKGSNDSTSEGTKEKDEKNVDFTKGDLQGKEEDKVKLDEGDSSNCDIKKGDDQTAYLTVGPVSNEKKLSISDVEISFEDTKTATTETAVEKTAPPEQQEEHIASSEPSSGAKIDPMSMSFYGTLPSGEDNINVDPMTSSVVGELPSDPSKPSKDPLESWGKPLGLPSPAPPGTPKKERKLPSNVMAKNKINSNDDRARSESPSKKKKPATGGGNNNAIYVDLTYVPHHGNSNYAYVDFFKRIRARYYVFSGIEPSREVYNALLEAKQTWDDKNLEVTIIPTYDTDVLGYWVAENEELLTKFKIDLSPSASRCTINLQDHETSCSAYRLEF